MRGVCGKGGTGVEWRGGHCLICVPWEGTLAHCLDEVLEMDSICLHPSFISSCDFKFFCIAVFTFTMVSFVGGLVLVSLVEVLFMVYT